MFPSLRHFYLFFSSQKQNNNDDTDNGERQGRRQQVEGRTIRGNQLALPHRRGVLDGGCRVALAKPQDTAQDIAPYCTFWAAS